MMRVLDGSDIDKTLEYPALVDILDAAFRADLSAPPRHHHAIDLGERPDATLLLMPAWSSLARNSPALSSPIEMAPVSQAAAAAPEDMTGEAPTAADTAGYIGIKMIAVIPDNNLRGLGAVQGSYLLLSALTGQPLAMMDAPTLTNWRTAGASALASRYLSRTDSSRLLMVGAGGLAPYLIKAHASVRPIKSVTIWNRSKTRAEKCAAGMRDTKLQITVTDNLEAAARQADIICVATLSAEPLIHGAWLRPGVHLDTVGAFRPDMRETDDEVVRRAHVFVDTRAGALGEAGDIVQPIRDGVISEDALVADLFDLTRARAAGRQTTDEITYFKSVGASLEDLATAIAIYEAD